MGVAALVTDTACDFLAGISLAAGNHHPGAEFCQQLGRGAANAAAGAGDDGDLAGEIERGVFHSCFLRVFVAHSGMRRKAQARNPYARSWLWIPGSRLRRAPE